jgi:hypothetical protein
VPATARAVVQLLAMTIAGSCEAPPSWWRCHRPGRRLSLRSVGFCPERQSKSGCGNSSSILCCMLASTAVSLLAAALYCVSYISRIWLDCVWHGCCMARRRRTHGRPRDDSGMSLLLTLTILFAFDFGTSSAGPSPSCIAALEARCRQSGGTAACFLCAGKQQRELRAADCTNAAVVAFCQGSTTCRNPFLWPFAANSIWNTPIGSAAQYSPAHIYNETLTLRDRGPPSGFHNDQDWIVRVSATDPLTQWINDAGQFPGGCNAKQSKGRPPAPPIRFPASLVTDCQGNNNAAAILQPDNKTLLQTQPLYRPKANGPLISWFKAGAPQDFPWQVDVMSGDSPQLQSALGSHGGSGLSGIGGTIRLGELLNSTGPILHALKLEVWSGPYYFGGLPNLQNSSCAPWSPPYTVLGSKRLPCVPSGGRNQYVWPAIGSDSGSQHGGKLYFGEDRHFAPGALLAIPPAVSETLALTTPVGRKIGQALTDFGGYIVDDTGSKRGGGAICMEPGVSDEVVAAYGPDQDFHIQAKVKPGSPLYADLLQIFRSLAVVTNNGPDSMGGGGTPRRPAPPPFCAHY